ncbi:TraB/GumN family protein [Paracoccus sulfuroxidans]|uniref:TraB family protein n=1 Tax=Paracoccus sulfuroxidans TaxID=384678 RepID=A0A562P0H6_9RHOB|nr:TraB/GumN family protein [Paracoccus sulfuroxidans]TWI37925.1 hypothetical protein IQ24_00056 [Paracoccus sulfuroxidans]
MRFALAVAALFLATPVAAMDCVGRDLMTDLSQARIDEIDAATAKVPYHRGLVWHASKDQMKATIVGTYHFDDPRHQATLERIGPELDAAAMLLVEAGPEEEAALANAMISDPNRLVNAEGPTLPERMTPEEWTQLSDEMVQRGIPAVMAAKMKPWYVSIILGVSPCVSRVLAAEGSGNGLDAQLIDRAEAQGLPIRALEPWDTIFTLFEGLTPDEEIEMIRTSLPIAKYADDYTTTLANAYFDGDIWRIWEFGRFDAYDNSGLDQKTVDEQFRLAEELLMEQRNREWIEPIDLAASEAAKGNKGIFVAFGALHLPGEEGVLRLLEKDGWTVIPAN